MAEIFGNLRWQDVLDILLISTILYHLMVLFRGTRAVQALAGLGVVGLFTLLAREAELILSSWLLQNLWAVILLVLVVIFQQELRHTLERVSPARWLTGWGRPPTDHLGEVVRAAFHLARQRIGALIVFQRGTRLDEIVRLGTPLGAEVTAPLLESLFTPASPLHDGAVVIDGTRVTHAGCMLPLSRREDLPPHFGTRHRAALGLTEETDAVSLAVSEERGEVTLMTGGTYRSRLSREEAVERLRVLLGTPERRMPAPMAWGALLLRRWPLKVGSLVVVTALWVYLGGAQKVEEGLRIPVEYRNIPESLTLSGRPATSLEVRLRGSRAVLGSMNRETLRATVDLGGTERGTNFVAVGRADVNVPAGVEVVGTDPAVLRLTLERVQRLRVAVRARLRGDPAPGYAVAGVTVIPGTVEIVGPESAVSNLQAVYTEPVDLTGAEGSFNRAVPLALFPERLALADGQVRTVEVRVTLRRVSS
jgi:uncharacterized protein (TIGR00159 family)